MDIDGDDIWHEDEETYWGGPLPKPGQGWALAASTYDGMPQWEPEYAAIGRAVNALRMFQEIPSHEPDWGLLLKGFRHLHVLADEDMESPPLCDLDDFELIGDFFYVRESQNEWGSRFLVYILEDEPTLTDPLLAEFEELARRLREYPPLQPYVRYM